MKAKVSVLEKFKQDEKRIFCRLCGKEIFKDVGKIKITTSDSSHRYKGSGIPFKNNYSLTCCAPCFKHMICKIEKAILDVYDNSKENKA